MSQFPDQQPPTSSNPYADASPADVTEKNTVGLVGFILSLVSIITCGVLAPVGLIVSIIGLTRPPRGFAIAGTIVGALLTLLAAVWVIGMWMGWGVMKQGMVLAAGQIVVQDHYANNGVVPTDQEFDQLLITQAADMPFLSSNGQIGVAYRYEIIDERTVRITLPGFDGQFGTQDDLSDVIDADPFGAQAPVPVSP